MRTVVVVLFSSVELMDFAGPAEVFIVADEGKAFQVITVGETTQSLKTMGGITIVPDYTFENVPKADILVVPGGNSKEFSKTRALWLLKASDEAEIVLSVCYGAFLLADAGLLDGIEATTHHWGLDALKIAAPKSTIIAGKRYVDSGKIVTTAGVAAGIDGALHIVERLLGNEAARWTAEEWMEYRR